MITQAALEEYEEYMIEKCEKDMLIREKNDATQYPYLCEHCRQIETYGSNRFCDDCKFDGFHQKDQHFDVCPDYDPNPICNGCGCEMHLVGMDGCENCRAEYESALCEAEYGVFGAEQQIIYKYRIESAASVVNIARAEVYLAQARLQKSEAMHDISIAEYNYQESFGENDTELEYVEAKLMQADSAIENAEVALRAAQNTYMCVESSKTDYLQRLDVETKQSLEKMI